MVRGKERKEKKDNLRKASSFFEEKAVKSSYTGLPRSPRWWSIVRGKMTPRPSKITAFFLRKQRNGMAEHEF